MKLIPSPCKSICKMKDNICIGCNRTTDEIANWSKFTNEQKHAIITRINAQVKRT
jgi:predicted Fe-S protein YdhL (DUF1289 family)